MITNPTAGMVVLSEEIEYTLIKQWSNGAWIARSIDERVWPLSLILMNMATIKDPPPNLDNL